MGNGLAEAVQNMIVPENIVRGADEALLDVLPHQVNHSQP